jgi:hypothetical protein
LQSGFQEICQGKKVHSNGSGELYQYINVTFLCEIIPGNRPKQTEGGYTKPTGEFRFHGRQIGFYVIELIHTLKLEKKLDVPVFKILAASRHSILRKHSTAALGSLPKFRIFIEISYILTGGNPRKREENLEKAVPLIEDQSHPVRGVSIQNLLDNCSDHLVVRVVRF